MPNELIVIENGEICLAPAVAAEIAEFERLTKEIADKEKKIKDELMKAMEATGVVSLSTDNLTISYVDGFDRETLDAKALREKYPDLYDEFVKMVKVKPSVRIKLK